MTYPPGGDAARILVVDDEPDVRIVLAETLAEEGYDASSCSSADAALAVLSERRCDLVLSDIRMPGRDGFALLREIRAGHPQLPVLLMTAQLGMDETRIAAADGFIAKPVTIEALLACVAGALARGRRAGSDT